MSLITISKDVLGLDTSIRINGKSFQRTDEYDNDFVFGSDTVIPRSIEDISSVFCLDTPELITPELRKSYETIHSLPVDWYRALGKQRFINHLKELSNSLRFNVNRIQSSRYTETLIKCRKILSLLQPAIVDRKEIEKLLCESENGFLRSFLPANGSECTAVKYSHNTATGRLIVSSGPKILNLTKSHRRVLKSRRKNGVIAMIDFVSLEPRTAYLLTKDDSPLDIYEGMRVETGSSLSRAKLKIATISSLYGSSHTDPTTMAAVNKFFNIQEITRKYLNKTPFENLYGRPLAPDEDRLRLSYFIQSTSVDVSLMGFSEIAERYKDIIPLFVLHDALVVDIETELFESLKTSGLEVEINPLGKYYLSVQAVDGV